MLAWLIILFCVVPFVELALLMYVAENVLGTWATLGLIVVTGVVGASLARYQGFSTLRKIQQQLSGGQMPTNSLADAGMILVAGAFLLTPGILTDAFGFSLLIPLCRQFYRRVVAAWMKRNVQVHVMRPGGQTPHGRRDVVDGQVVVLVQFVRIEHINVTHDRARAVFQNLG